MARSRLWLAVVPVGLLTGAACTAGDVATAGPGKAEAPPRIEPPSYVTRGPDGDSETVFAARGTGLTTHARTFDATVTDGVLEIAPRRERAAVPLTATGQSLSLETTRIARGAWTIAGHGETRLAPDGSVTVARSSVLERIASDGASVEQSWRFETLPGTTGDLYLQVRAKGAPFRASTDHGLHFAGGGLGIRYGMATWIDASGARTVVRPLFADDHIVLRVPDAVLRRSSFPAVLDPTVLPEKEIDTPITGASASGDQYAAAIAPVGPGQGYFAVWYDRRGVRPALYGAHLASNGTVTDATGLPIANGVGTAVPVVSRSDDGYLVAWTIQNVDLYQDAGVYAVRLDNNGNPIDKSPIRLATGTNSRTPAAAFDGQNWLVVWQSYNSQTYNDISAVRVPKVGAPLDATPLAVSEDYQFDYEPSVFFDGADFLVTWRTSYQANLRKVAKDGSLGSPVVLALPGNYLYGAQTAYGSGQVLVAWAEYSGATFTDDIFARRFNTAGTPLDVGPITVIADDIEYDERPRPVFDGANFLVTWNRGGALNAARVSTAGAAMESAVSVHCCNYYSDFAVASDGAGSAVLSRQYGSGIVGSDVHAVRVASPPVAASSTVISKAANTQTDASVAFNGSHHYAVWLDTRDGRTGIYGARLAADGTAEAPTGLVTDPTYFELGRPRITSNGTDFFVVFYAYKTSPTSSRGVRALRIDAQGTPSVDGVFDVHTASTSVNDFYRDPNVAWDGAQYFVVWEDQTPEGTSVAGIPVPATGTTITATEPTRIATGTTTEKRTQPSIAFDGTNHFVTWLTSRTSGAGIEVSHVAGSRLAKGGAVLDGETVICDAFLLQRAPFVTADPKGTGGFFVVWEDYRTALEAADIYGARISLEGANLDGTAGLKIAAGTHDEARPRAAPSGDGANWIVAWRDLRSRETYDLYGSWVSVEGKVHDPTGFLFSAEPGDEDGAWLTPSIPGQMLLAYQRLDPASGYGSYRLRARVINAGAQRGSACQSGDECASRSCITNICCGSACGGCGVCNVIPGTCTTLPAGSEPPTCPGYKCKGEAACPTSCESDADCAQNAVCDPPTRTCLSRTICVDSDTLKDLSGQITECAPYKCIGDACQQRCGSVDDCAAGFVCDFDGRCIPGPGAAEVSACATFVPTRDRAWRGRVAWAGGLTGFGFFWIIRRRRARRNA